MMLICILTVGKECMTVSAAGYPLSVSVSPTGNDYEYRIDVTNISSESVTVRTMSVNLYRSIDGIEDYWGSYGDVCDLAGNVVVGSPDGVVASRFSVDPEETVSFIAEPALQYSGFLDAYTSEGSFIHVSIGSPDARGDLAEYRYMISQEVQEPEPQTPPEITEGNNGSWEQGNAEGLTFRSSADFSGFQKVLVDDNEIPGTVYTVSEGSTIVTLSPEYLDTLTSGVHMISIVSESGTATGTFTVTAKEQQAEEEQNPVVTPGTDDNVGEQNKPSANNTESLEAKPAEEGNADISKTETDKESNNKTTDDADKAAEQTTVRDNVKKSPKTGDESPISVYTAAVLITALCLACAIKKYRRQK